MAYQQITPHEDPVLRKIVIYVADFLNSRWTSDRIVNHTEIYDSFSVPHDSYPLLKIYRRYTRATMEDSQRDSEITLSYCTLNVQTAKTPAITNWVDINIREALQQFVFDHPAIFEIKNTISCRYRTILQLSEIVHQVEIDFTLNQESNTACIVQPVC